MKYLKGTKYMKLTLTVDTMAVIKWWVEASHHVHDNCRGHTGALMSLGKGTTLSHSSKHKLNTKSSTESELVSAEDILVKVLWSLYLFKPRDIR